MMSGGVDSSVAAAILRDAGPRRHRRHAEAVGRRERQRVLQRRRRRGRASRRRAARHSALRVQLQRRASTSTSSTPYVDAYAAGETPNPCVECNRDDEVRAQALERAPAARFRRGRDRPPRARRRDAGRTRARTRARDAAKDQSYVLYMLGRRRARANLAPRRRAHEGRRARAGAGARAAHGRQAREHGRVLHHTRRAGVVPRQPDPAPIRA